MRRRLHRPGSEARRAARRAGAGNAPDQSLLNRSASAAGSAPQLMAAAGVTAVRRVTILYTPTMWPEAQPCTPRPCVLKLRVL